MDTKSKPDPVEALRCEASFGLQGYEPERWTILKDDVYAAIESLSDAVEYAREVLDTHETNLGRSTLKNRLWAERIERDIAKMGALRERLRKYGPVTMPTPNTEQQP